ncbi:hypothetical protein H6F86_00135 [Phormidium sp. FACHB-592]|uniref:Uncharacterized protein n=1 Tax=Stenomitos frigidus AS-A4 TaxID=2933935 RepID=A0ABV0KTY5_9CYAN|nr:hypothetical protein [Phormidium sp. FACHB-592]MBD2072342.1 hypothetical protein [Phormidium sp. FACHB-592]
MNAWLLTWEGTEGPAVVPDKKIVAIISGRLSSKTIEEVVDILYRRSIGPAYDMASLANKRKQREDEYRLIYSQSNRFFYGRSALCIYARKVFNLKVERDESHQVERVRWTEFAYLQMKEPETMPQEVEPATEKELLRKLNEPLALDILDAY